MPPTSQPIDAPKLILGTAYALGAGLLWGLVFVVPLLLPSYSGLHLSVGRYLAFGIIALGFALVLPATRRAVRVLSHADWCAALWLSLVGNLIYYATLASAISLIGAPVPTLLIGTLPVVIAICSNWAGDVKGAAPAKLPWRALLPSLLLIAAGLACVNTKLFSELGVSGALNFSHYAGGVALALCAVAAWTWYPIRNAHWMRANPQHTGATWATAQGIATLPLALVGYVGLIAWTLTTDASRPLLGAALGASPALFVTMMLALGLGASWLGTLWWNRASALLPTALAGQLIVFETLAALGYAFVWAGRWPSVAEGTGIVLLIGGVLLGVRCFSRQS